MAREAPTARITLGGKERTLRWDLAAVIDFEEWSGINLMDPEAVDVREGETPEQALERVFRSPKVIAQLLTAMLRHEDEDLEWREVARMVDVTAMDRLMETAFSVYEAGQPEPEESEEGEQEADGQDPTTGEMVTA